MVPQKVDTVDDFVPFREGARTMLVGSSGSGKTKFISRLVQERNHFFEVPPPKVIFCSHSGSREQHTSELQKELVSNDGRHSPLVEFINHVPDNSELFEPHTMLIFDDMLSDEDSAANLQRLLSFFRRRAHHERLYCFITAQSLFSKLRDFGDLSQNASYMLLFKSPRMMQQIRYFATQLTGVECARAICEAYKDIMKRFRFPHMYLSFHPLTNEKTFCLANLFADEDKPIVSYLLSGAE